MQISPKPIILLLITLLATACAAWQPEPLPEPQIRLVEATQITSSPSTSSTLTFTPDPYAELTVEDLAAREYGGGELLSLEMMSSTPDFTRYLISYPSDGLNINGFMDVPLGEGPFPVLLLLHGYVSTQGYLIETYTARYAQTFAEAGYIVLHPNYRNYPPSDRGPNLFRVGYAIDVLNLIALVNEQAGMSGPLEQADGDIIFLWGHSMGGGIIQRVVTVGAQVNGAVLYGSMSGDESQNFEHILNVLSDGERAFPELEVSDEALQRISPSYHYERITVPISIHHGNIDDVVPLAWSEDLCARLEELGKEVECFTYRNMPHIFYGLNDDEFIQRSLDFFQRNMR